MNKLLNITCWKPLLLTLGIASVGQAYASDFFLIGNLNSSKPAKFKLFGANGRELVVSLFPKEACFVNDLSYLPRQGQEKTVIITDMDGQVESIVITQKTESAGIFNMIANGVKDFKAMPFYVQDNDTKEWRTVGKNKISLGTDLEKLVDGKQQKDYLLGIDNVSTNPQFPSNRDFFRQSIFSCYDKYTGFGNAASPVVPSVIHANIPFWSSKAK
ncbi:MAG: hypothetical protein E6Q33_01815 [Neisseriales bacterium]|nr:MAG: hypothetical protein E6Q33_01815 [Neisseriales bacterium]